MTYWVPELTGHAYRDSRSGGLWRGYEAHVDVDRTEQAVSEPLRQSVEDFILCQHSRDSFAPSKLGVRRAEFDAQMRDILSPHADEDGMLTFRSMTEVTVARLKA